MEMCMLEKSANIPCCVYSNLYVGKRRAFRAVDDGKFIVGKIGEHYVLCLMRFVRWKKWRAFRDANGCKFTMGKIGDHSMRRLWNFSVWTKWRAFRDANCRDLTMGNYWQSFRAVLSKFVCWKNGEHSVLCLL